MANIVDITAEEFGNWLRGLPQATLVGVQVTSADPSVLVRQSPLWQYLCHTRGRAVDQIIAAYQFVQTVDQPWMIAFSSACAAAFTPGQPVAAIDALTQFDFAVPAQQGNIEEQPQPG